VQHFYEEIPGFFWFETGYRRMLEALPKTTPSAFVEIGSYKGKSAAFLAVEILNRGLPTTIHCVDSWACPNGEVGEGPRIRDEFHRHLAPVATLMGPRFVVHQADSLVAATEFADASVDVVWVDGDHEYEAAKADILAWWPKIKPGGFMGGDDFMMYGVAKAVCEQFAPDYILCHGWTTEPTPMPWPSWLTRKA
jgi:methyltransferase family protein